MAKQESSKKPTNAKAKDTNKEKETYKSPTDTWWGKTLIWILAFGMLGVVIIGLIIALVAGGA